MQIISLAVNTFRNINSCSLHPSPGTNIFYGNNGSGKTNLLEAIFVLCLGRSQRGANDTVLVKETDDVYRINGVIESKTQQIEVSVAFARGGRKKITIDKVTARASELYDCFSAVSAGPEDSELLSGSPSVRRGFLDIYLSQFSRRYLDLLTDYRKVLAQKNAALKAGMDTEPFDYLMVDYGSQLMLRRNEFLLTLREKASLYYSEISSGSDFSLTYSPSVPIDAGWELDEINKAFTLQLEQNKQKEKILERTLVGPHRDDIEFMISGFPSRTHGSQGEWRTAAISLKLSVYHMLKELHGTPPVLLLDEIFAELDPGRAEHLIEAFGSLGQLFLTTAAEPPQSLKANGQSFKISSGEVEEVS